MEELKYQELLEILNKHDVGFYGGPAKSSKTQEGEAKELNAELEKYIAGKDIQEKAVLGIDIYRYGSMEEKARNLVPFVAHILRDEAIDLCLESESFFFHNITKETIENDFINTGDGGYFIFDTPLHALVFAIYFELAVRAFNSYHLYPKLRTILGKYRPTLRYAMTYDNVYKYGHSNKYNHYGAGIITNARILSKDKLDRFLIDENVYDWFMRNTNGIDNLQILHITDIAKNVKEYEYFKGTNYQSSIFPAFSKIGMGETDNDRYSRLNSVDVQKIGEIEAKNQEKSISIYNLHIQYSTRAHKNVEPQAINTTSNIKLTVSLGNLNVSGISDE